MTKQERRERRGLEQAHLRRVRDEAQRKSAERDSLISLFEALPNSVNSLFCRLYEHFEVDSANPPRWGQLLDGSEVPTFETDQAVRRVLLWQLSAIVDWCAARSVDLVKSIGSAIERVESLERNPWVLAQAEPEKSGIWLLEIMENLATGERGAAEADLMTMWALLPVKYTMSFLENAILEDQFEVRIETAQDCPGAEAGAASDEHEAETPSDGIAGGGATPIIQKPKWDREARKLSFRGKVRKFSPQTGANVIALLNVFEEFGWRDREDNPIDANSSSQALRTMNNNDLPLRFKKDGDQIEWIDTSH